MYDIVIIGGGIVGLAAGWALGRRLPAHSIAVLEKESELAAHQSGRNSGVLHSGVYYAPGSKKARLCVAGNRSMVDFCNAHQIAHDICGKVIVATEAWELPLLEHLFAQGKANGLRLVKLSPERLIEREPHANGLAALLVPSAGLVDFKQVCKVLAGQIEAQGGYIRLRSKVQGVQRKGKETWLKTPQGTVVARFVVNCAGLFCDRIARWWEVPLPARIVPFRGEYFDLAPAKRHLLKHLIYPVPHPKFPFLGVHLTRSLAGHVHVGPNAVLSLKREGYAKTDVNLKDLFETFSYAGFWRLAARNLAEGSKEWARSLYKPAFVRRVRRLLPEVQARDLSPAAAGVRAQALTPEGNLVHDFLWVSAPNALHVLNAPSPAATCSLEIGNVIAAQVAQQLK